MGKPIVIKVGIYECVLVCTPHPNRHSVHCSATYAGSPAYFWNAEVSLHWFKLDFTSFMDNACARTVIAFLCILSDLQPWNANLCAQPWHPHKTSSFRCTLSIASFCDIFFHLECLYSYNFLPLYFFIILINFFAFILCYYFALSLVHNIIHLILLFLLFF